MDYLALNIVWVIANGILFTFYIILFPKIFGSNHGVANYSRVDLPILRDMFDTDVKKYLAIAIFIIFTLYSIKKYKENREENVFPLILTIILGAVQMYFTITITHF